ncbi:MAG: hypothetical protein LC102_07115 [Ignavibacteriales bacterium]|nr:MAG: hypothetical protein F9K26_10740 [Ignavibacteriaceae bacterium]MBW7874080.1 hypothetical protein [Ignavibacteria bacterium]MCZ2143180.1 hypothetical protein [Ignavibacteriales bacterium]OQY74668.1 MAG: hypothetical protein B6D45_06555 [Ignavibacteriales bacterium UTCHB3]MBV6444061.1 hypothetical protein [Ignavibacteriaceae bacterium]
MRINRTIFLVFSCLSFFFLLSAVSLAQEGKKKEEVTVPPDTGYVPAPVEVPGKELEEEEPGAVDRGFYKEMPDEAGLVATTDFLLGMYTAKAEKKETAFKNAVEGAKTDLSSKLNEQLENYQLSLKKEKLTDAKDVFDAFAKAGETAKAELLKNPEIIDSSFSQVKEGWEATVLLEVKVEDLQKKLVDLSKDKPSLVKTKLFKDLAASAAIKE